MFSVLLLYKTVCEFKGISLPFGLGGFKIVRIRRINPKSQIIDYAHYQKTKEKIYITVDKERAEHYTYFKWFTTGKHSKLKMPSLFRFRITDKCRGKLGKFIAKNPHIINNYA